MASRSSSPHVVYKNAQEVFAGLNAIRDYTQQSDALEILPSLVHALIAAHPLAKPMETTFHWKCESIQTNPSENHLFRFLNQKPQMCLHWAQATCYERELEGRPSLHQLLPPLFRHSLMELSGMSEDTWAECAHAVCPKQITVIPQDSINAVELSLHSMTFPHVFSMFTVLLIWPTISLRIKYEHKPINTSLNLHSLLVYKPPCLIVVFPEAECNRNSLDQTSYTFFVDHNKTQRLSNPVNSAIQAQFNQKPPALTEELQTYFEIDLWSPFAFLLDVAETSEKETATFNLFQKLPFSEPD